MWIAESARRRDLGCRKQEHKALLLRAPRDAFTGPWNLANFLETLAREIKSARQHGTPLAVTIIVVHHFKRINDTRGHQAGEEVLRTPGAKLIGRTRTADCLGRSQQARAIRMFMSAPRIRCRHQIATAGLSAQGSPQQST
jgi:PleD family two-component response regulator